MVIILKQHRRPTEPKLEWHLPLIVRKPAPRPLVDEQRVAEILNETADRHGVPPVLILGKRRSKPIVEARHAFIAAVMREYKLTLSHGAAYFKLDRDTIRNALKMNLKREVERELKINGHI